MAASMVSEGAERFPGLGLLALATTLIVYILSQLDGWKPPLLLTAAILVTGGSVQLLVGLRSQMTGQVRSAVTLLPLGIFWLSLISYQVFPQLGFGHRPGSIAMFSFLSLWGLFMALLFLGSFRQSLAVQILYGTMMFSFLALAMDNLRQDQVFLMIGCAIGVGASLVSVYMFAAQLMHHIYGRDILPLGAEREN